MNVAYKQQKLRNNFSYKQQFSFFMTISDQYRKENFHSDILKVILDPHTVQIGTSEYLKLFLETIGLKKNTFGDSASIKKYVTVEREEHRVDLLIKYDNPKDKKAIIIENKINNAVDQDNQLARYFEILKNDGYKVLKIPYITLFGGKTPDYSKWEPKYKNFIKQIFTDETPLFFDLPVIENKGSHSIIQFLSECIKKHEAENNLNQDNQLALMFLQQYKLLLEEIAEDSGMSDTEINNIKKLFEDDKKAQIQALLNNWEQRGKCAYEYIVRKLPNDNEIKIRTIYGAQCLTIEKKNKYFDGVYLYPAESSIQIGFYRKENNWGPKITKDAEKHMQKICLEILKTEIENNWIMGLKNWYCVNIQIDQFKTFDEINTNFTNALRELSKFKS